ncbi:MAG TPA: hypothetical protein VF791_13220 [Pyrinomonadaceae bacterium]
MNTRTRRFILRLLVGLLTFAIGVAAAMVLGGFRPLQSFERAPCKRGYYQRYRSFSPPPASRFDLEFERIYPSSPPKRGHAHLGELAVPPPLTAAPLPPDPPQAVR